MDIDLTYNLKTTDTELTDVDKNNRHWIECFQLNMTVTIIPIQTYMEFTSKARQILHRQNKDEKVDMG